MAGDGPPFAVEADLDVTVAGETVGVEGHGDLVVIDAPSFAALRALRRGVGRLPPAVAPGRAADAGVTVDLRVRGVSVARIDPDADAGRLAVALGVAPARPSLGGLLRALLRAVG